jgi:hypothetical protein
MKNALAGGVILLVTLAVAGCASGPSSSVSTSSFRGAGSRCPGPADTTGSQPLLYLLCVQTN